MRVLAALAIGTCCALVVGALMGSLPERRAPRPRRRVRADRARAWIQQSGLAVTPLQLWAGSTAAGLLAFLLVTALTGSPLVAIVPAVTVALVPRAYFGRRRLARLRAVQAAWPDGLRDLVSSISAGRSLTQAVSALATSGPPALREAFARFPQQARMLGTGPALELVKEELADPTSAYSHSHRLRVARAAAGERADRSLFVSRGGFVVVFGRARLPRDDRAIEA